MRFKKRNRWRTSKEEVKYRAWRKIVMELNFRKKGLSKYYVCEKCSKKRKTTRITHAHHIYSWKKFPTKRYDKTNGIVMCKKCHKSFHKKYKFKALSDPECLFEYLKK